MLIDDPVKDEKMIRGDLLPFEELFKLHHGKVYAVCLRMTGNTAEAEDLTQEVFVQVFRTGTHRDHLILRLILASVLSPLLYSFLYKLTAGWTIRAKHKSYRASNQSTLSIRSSAVDKIFRELIR